MDRAQQAMVAATRDIRDADSASTAELERAVDRLCQLVDDVIGAEVIADAYEGEPADLRLGSMIERAVAPARRDAHARGIPFHVQCDPTLVVRVNPGAVIATLGKVAENAVKFSDRGDVAIEVERQGAEVAVHVRDNRDGLPAGIRLIVARRALLSQGWTISAECAVNVRSHICPTLPAAPT